MDKVTGEYVSKNELKKREKLRKNEAKKKEKNDAKEQTSESKVEDELDPSKYTEIRKNWLQERRNQGENPYPHKFHRTHRVDEFVNEFEDK